MWQVVLGTQTTLNVGFKILENLFSNFFLGKKENENQSYSFDLQQSLAMISFFKFGGQIERTCINLLAKASGNQQRYQATERN